MTEKQKNALNKIIVTLPNDCRKSYLEVAEYAISLGYMPALTGKNEDKADFRKSKTKKTILSIRTKNNSPQIAMSFYALQQYTGVFKEALEKIYNYENTGYETRCFECENKCGQCGTGIAYGYSIILPDGKYGFICGHCVIPLPTFCAENIQEVKEALKIQDEFYLKKMSE
ncbi:MAG: hypothetical protein FWE06_06335 [Oscillospiraceae bacterium]|nr:hypothetical protein [Oscillospiraceae bacterium]